jgi:putative pyoverdin transport system ATP-binding/permease protein
VNILWLLIQESWLSVAIAIFTGLISGACSAQLIVLTNTVISAGSTENLIWYFAGLAAIALFTGIISQFLLIDLAQNAVYKLRIRLSQEILAAPLQQLEELGANRLLASLTEDVQSISNSVFVIPFICIDVAVVVGCLIYLGGLSIIVFSAVLIFIGLAIAFIQILINKIFKLFAIARIESDTLYKHFRSITEGIKELKLHSARRGEFFTAELEVSAGKLKHIRTKAFQISAIATVGGELIFFILLGMLLFGLPQIIPVTKPVLGAYILTLTYLVKPLQSILERLPNLFAASVAVQKVRMMGLELARQAEVNSQISTSFDNWQKDFRQELKLNHITHSYRGEDSHFTLGELNLTFKSGELVFIIGGNGSGKSTLVKILTGLYIPESGTIEIDGVVITEQNREWYRQHFSVIFADFYLFDRLLGIKGVNGINDLDIDQQAQKYLAVLQLSAKVQVSNGNFSTTSLSQGQRKRLALLTAYLEDRPIYVFDEWASDQDPLFRDIFYKQLLPDLKARGKTVIVISHDDRYFEIADRVIKLDYGKVEYDR